MSQMRKTRVKAATTEAPAKKIPVKVTPAKGRPMLTWVGKRPLSHLTAFPAQPVETFDPTGQLSAKPGDPDFWKDWPSVYPQGGLLFHGDKKEVLAHLLANGFRRRRSLTIDPPFDSGADYVRKVSLRGPKGTAKLEGETYSLGEQIQYTDIWTNDNYLQFMYDRLQLLAELLSDSGFLFIQCGSFRCGVGVAGNDRPTRRESLHNFNGGLHPPSLNSEPTPSMASLSGTSRPGRG